MLQLVYVMDNVHSTESVRTQYFVIYSLFNAPPFLIQIYSFLFKTGFEGRILNIAMDFSQPLMKINSFCFSVTLSHYCLVRGMCIISILQMQNADTWRLRLAISNDHTCIISKKGLIFSLYSTALFTVVRTQYF